MQKYLTFTVLLFCVFYLPAKNIDSLKFVLHQQNDPDEKIETLVEICSFYDVYESFQKDSLEHYGNQILQLADRARDPLLRSKARLRHALSLSNKDTTYLFQTLRECVDNFIELDAIADAAYTLHRMAGRYRSFSLYDKSLFYAEKAKNLIGIPENNEEGNVLIRIYSLIASIKQNAGFLLESLENALKTKELADKYGSTESQLRALLSLGSLYGNLALDNRDYGSEESRRQYHRLAEEYMHQHYKLAFKHDNYRMRIISSYNLGLLYSEKEDWEQSHHYLDQAIQAAETIDYKESLINALRIKAANLMDQSIADSSLVLFERAYELAQETISPNIKISATYDLGHYYYQAGQYDKSLQFVKEGMQMAMETQNRMRLKTGYNNLYEVYKKMGKPGLALEHYEKFIALKDSVANATVLKDLESLRTRYETAEKEKKIAQLNAEKTSQALSFQRKTGAAIIAFLLIGLASSILFFRNRQRILMAKQEAVELEQRLLRSQMNPHFTFNALSSIQSFLLTGKAEKGAYYLTKFAKLMRQILSQSQSSMISLQEEIDTIENYLALQQLRYDNRFDYQLEVDPHIDAEQVMIPPMLIQPVLENAIEHGKIYRQDNGKVAIEINCDKNMLHIDILDNGIGRNNAYQKSAPKHESLALKIINSRLRNLKEKYGKEVNFKILDPDQGGYGSYF